EAITYKAQCGYPGELSGSYIKTNQNPDRRYEDGEMVSYHCPDDEIYKKVMTRKCVNGKWIGESPKCGKTISYKCFIFTTITISNLFRPGNFIPKLQLQQ